MPDRRPHARILLAAVILSAATRGEAGFEQALSDLKAGKYLEASAGFQALVDQAPAYDYGHYMLGHCFLRMNKPDEAVLSFLRAIALRKDRPEYYHGLAVAYRGQKHYGHALSTLAEGARFVRDPATAFGYHSLRGSILALLQDWRGAAASFEGALALRKDRVVLNMLGKSYFSLGEYEKALSVFLESLRFDPDDVRILPLAAESAIRRAMEIDDRARKKATYARAMAVAQVFHGLRPADRDAWDLLGRSALGAGRYDVAEQAFRAVLASGPGSCYAMVNLSRSLVTERRWEDAERALIEAESCAPSLPAAHEGLGYVYFREGRFRESLEAYRKADGLQSTPLTRAGIAAAETRVGPREAAGIPPRGERPPR